MSTVTNVTSQNRNQNISCFSSVINCVCSNTTTAKTVKVAAFIIGVALVASVCVIPMSATLGSVLAYVGLWTAIVSAYSLMISSIIFSSRPPSSGHMPTISRHHPGEIALGNLYTTFEDVRARPAYYLNLVAQSANAFPERVKLVNRSERAAIDVGGITQEFISKLIAYLPQPSRSGSNPTVRLNDTLFPMLEKDESTQPYIRLGMLYSIIDKKNTLHPSAGLLTGTLFHAGFFEIVKRVANGGTTDELRIVAARQMAAAESNRNPIWLPLILGRGSEQSLLDYVIESNKNIHTQITTAEAQEQLEAIQENMDQVVRAARAFYQGATVEFQRKIRDTANSANLAVQIQGEPISAQSILDALSFTDISPDYQRWIIEKIQSSNEEWRMMFVSVITGCRSLSSSTRIYIGNVSESDQEKGCYKINTCFSSIKVLVGLEKDDFLLGLDGALRDGYNTV